MRAIALFSGGLDSILAVALIVKQGIDVTALYVDIGFGGRVDKTEEMRELVEKVGADFLKIDIREQFVKDILFSPVHGYGKNFNPCIDCHANMFRIAKAMMPKLDAQFLISGEVVGQRPMSQNNRAINLVAEFAETDDLLLRPLSAKHLKETIPEKEGWVDREKLFGISGRSRKIQFELAKEFGIENFESPAGGCLLTDAYFTKKIRDFVKFDTFKANDIESLKFGRHFRLPDGAKLVIGKNAVDNENLKLSINDKFISLEAVGVKSPFALLSKNHTEKDLKIALQSVLAHTKAEIEKEYEVLIDGETRKKSSVGIRDEVRKFAIV
ncbi:putative tRNA(5-methylaminomethyl-2-thiouridylate) methyltransferase with PP-loop ATPase domain [Thiovulum sp. ES]|nr:putative tRNA(5-methylaminomethyl-2-thiouridylate) methyltransferase with PP-loop ATPase domain [Thiovulum sp. ES]